MKDSEKKMIIILIIIAVVVIIVLNIFAKANTKPQNEQTNTGTIIGNVTGEEQKNETQREEKKDEYVQVLQDGSKLNISDNIAKDKILDGLVISNIQLKAEGKTTRLLADIENKTGETTKDKMVKIEVLEKSGKIIASVRGFIDPIEARGKGKLNVYIPADVSNAYDIRISNV